MQSDDLVTAHPPPAAQTSGDGLRLAATVGWSGRALAVADLVVMSFSDGLTAEHAQLIAGALLTSLHAPSRSINRLLYVTAACVRLSLLMPPEILRFLLSSPMITMWMQPNGIIELTVWIMFRLINQRFH